MFTSFSFKAPIHYHARNTMKMQVTIRHADGLVLPVQVPSDARAGLLKAAVFHSLGITPHEQDLIFQGRLLDDSDPIREVGIESGSTVILSLRSNFYDEVESLVQANILSEYEKDEFIEDNAAAFFGYESEENIEVSAKIADLQFDLIESSPDGFRSLVRNYEEIEQHLSLQDEIEQQNMFPTVIKNADDGKVGPSTEPMPFMFLADD